MKLILNKINVDYINNESCAKLLVYYNKMRCYKYYFL